MQSVTSNISRSADTTRSIRYEDMMDDARLTRRGWLPCLFNFSDGMAMGMIMISERVDDIILKKRRSRRGNMRNPASVYKFGVRTPKFGNQTWNISAALRLILYCTVQYR
jgi:hypothetical protein